MMSEMTEEEKKNIWTRIDTEATAWRYNIYNSGLE
jgi:hypothetical protein